MSTDARGSTYRLVLGGELGDRFGILFGGMSISRDDGNTVLTGQVADQAHLAGILERVQELGLELLSVETVEPAPRVATGNSGIGQAG